MNQNTIAQKLLRVQQSIEKVTKTSKNPHFRSTFADLNEVLAVSKGALNEENIFIAQGPGKDQFGQYVETTLINGEDGQSLSSRVYFSGTEDNMQKIGAAITYARRFGLASLLALESQDDDGETAVGRGAQKSYKIESTTAPKETPKTTKSSETVNGNTSTSEVNKTSRETTNKLISQYSKVALDKRATTVEQLNQMLQQKGASKKEELSDEQAQELLNTLKGFVNG